MPVRRGNCVHRHSDRRLDNLEKPATQTAIGPMAAALAINTVFFGVEIVGGILTDSLALLADAGHMAVDVGSLALSLFAIWLARRPSTPAYSFGYLRAEILAALVNAAALIAISIVVFVETIRRLASTPQVKSGPMLVVALAGLLANGLSAWILMRTEGHHENLNVRGAFLHVVSDLAGSAAAIVAALIMLTTGWYLADPLLSAAIGLLILFSAWRLLRDSLDVLMQATPAHIDVDQVKREMASVPGVVGVHDLHIWTVTSGLIALSAHVEVTGDPSWHDLMTELAGRLRERFGIEHVTLQPEDPHVTSLTGAGIADTRSSGPRG
jgi:cobalt-zinc-cadmium efflux system protein